MVDKFPLWQNLAINLGVPINQVQAFQMQTRGGLKALSYWRNGKSGEAYPSTWDFLLKVVEETEGSKPAEDLLRLVNIMETDPLFGAKFMNGEYMCMLLHRS